MNSPIANTDFLTALQTIMNQTRTENGAKTLRSTGSDVLDLFAAVGALRQMSDEYILRLFYRAWAEDRDLAMKILFYARDVRGGLGERSVFRTILHDLAKQEPESIRKNISLIPFYGRYDDLLDLLDTPCEANALDYIREELSKDLASLNTKGHVSLLAKWLPSVNASSKKTRQMAERIAQGIGMNCAAYRKTLSKLRAGEQLLENNLRERDYNFDYAAQPSKAMFKYRKAFYRNDSIRYNAFLDSVMRGKAIMHTGTLFPYDLVQQAMKSNVSISERKALDTAWNALEDYTNGRNALAVIDVSGSMYGISCGKNGPKPIEAALSLGLYFAERNNSIFKNTFITFSAEPELVQIKGADLIEKLRYMEGAHWGMNTDIEKVFYLILKAAVYFRLSQSELPETIYIISDMEFDACADHADKSNFENAKEHFEEKGYHLPNLVFWNVQSRNQQVPVSKNEQGVALVSGSSPRIFSMVMKDTLDPYQFMMEIIGSERYAQVRA